MTTSRYIVLKTAPGVWYVKDTADNTLYPFHTKRAANENAARRNAR